MSLQLFEYPFSSYCQKALIALYEHAMPFEFRMLDAEHPDNGAELEKRWPLKRFPGLLDGERLAAEASIIVEYVNQRARNGPTLIGVFDTMASLARRYISCATAEGGSVGKRLVRIRR
jgi:glutathione S-transferase